MAQPIPLSMGGILYLTDTAADQGLAQYVTMYPPDWIEHDV